MAQFHFVEDYENFVRQLLKTYPPDEAMSLAVGGDYDRIGSIECEIMRHAGLGDGVSMVDFGCGSGRLAVHLARTVRIDYLGLDVVQPLLDYAKSRCPAHYRFRLNHARTLPVETGSIDWFGVFSVFTHLLHAETYLYLEEMHRALKPGGRIVASFLELALDEHWPLFAATVEHQRASTLPHLNQFIEREQFAIWAKRLGFASIDFIPGNRAPWPSGEGLGQSVAILRKPD